ncbi:MAG: hypothetical protein GY847_29165 [Proteobacteria bacterium]|nr:hypothetical protein [Pseudomonadota bacterium]
MLSFFGQFMLEKRLIGRGQLQTALDLMDKRNLPLGVLAINEGYLSEKDVYNLNRLQRNKDSYLGELAIEYELMTQKQISRLLEKQRSNNFRIGDALVELGFLSKNDVEKTFNEYMEEQKLYRGASLIPNDYLGSWLIETLINYIPRLLPRIAQLNMKVGRPGTWQRGFAFDYSSSVTIEAKGSCRLIIAATKMQAGGIAKKMFQLEEDEYLSDDLMIDGLSEILNLLADNILERALDDGVGITVGLLATGDLPEEGIVLPSVTPHGKGVFIISQLTESDEYD